MSTPSLPPAAKRPEVHGHRGCRGLFPENTLPAFLHALALGVDVLELDVVISHDRQVVVSHEPWLSAKLGPGPNGEAIDPNYEREYNLYQLSYATIRRCPVGEKPHPDFPAQYPESSYRPLLSEVLTVADAACQQLGRSLVGYSVEIKSTSAGDDIFHPQPIAFAELVLAELRAASVQARTTVMSFDSRILQAVRRQAPAQALCLLSEAPTPAAKLFEQLGFVPDTFGPDFRLLSQPMVQALSTDFPSLRLVPWTVNKAADLQQLVQWGVSGITTDFPDRLLALLAFVNAGH